MKPEFSPTRSARRRERATDPGPGGRVQRREQVSPRLADSTRWPPAGGRSQAFLEFALASSGDARWRLDWRGEVTSLVCC